MIRPDWEVTMHMWPMPETPLKRINSIDVPEMNDQDLTPIGMPPSTEPKQLEGTSTKMKLGDRPNIKPKRKELSGFAAWMAGQEPKSTKR
jgi:hypothetical protein